jgi:hypothetical protein
MEQHSMGMDWDWGENVHRPAVWFDTASFTEPHFRATLLTTVATLEAIDHFCLAAFRAENERHVFIIKLNCFNMQYVWNKNTQVQSTEFLSQAAKSQRNSVNWVLLQDAKSQQNSNTWISSFHANLHPPPLKNVNIRVLDQLENQLPCWRKHRIRVLRNDSESE